MKYVQRQEDGNWKAIEVSDANDPAIADGNWYKLVEHEHPIEHWGDVNWQHVELLTVQENLKQLHRHYRVAPIDAYEPVRPTIV